MSFLSDLRFPDNISWPGGGQGNKWILSCVFKAISFSLLLPQFLRRPLDLCVARICLIFYFEIQTKIPSQGNRLLFSLLPPIWRAVIWAAMCCFVPGRIHAVLLLLYRRPVVDGKTNKYWDHVIISVIFWWSGFYSFPENVVISSVMQFKKKKKTWISLKKKKEKKHTHSKGLQVLAVSSVGHHSYYYANYGFDWILFKLAHCQEWPYITWSIFHCHVRNYLCLCFHERRRHHLWALSPILLLRSE